MKRTLLVGALVLGVVAAILLIGRPGTDDSGAPTGGVASDMDGGVPSGTSERPRPRTPEETRASTAAAVQADEAEARGRFARGVEIISLGTAPTGITPDALYDALMPNELRFAQCVTRAGGFDAMREAMRNARRVDDPAAAEGTTQPRAPRAQRTEPSTAMVSPSAPAPEGERRRTGRSAGFDVRADGTVDPATIVLDPDVPEPFRACFMEHVGGLVLPNAGAEGAHVQMPMPGPRQRGPVPLTGDGGVPIPTPSAERRAIAP